ncbi:unnamed protein product [Rotaria sp. Silwood2]|nr:unnamed protein product [Rotaria sp. Silwood2]CAF4136688.1 unnamed protein product [Rotaria sp. Silwood2]
MFIKVEIGFLTRRPTLSLIANAGETVNEEECVDRTYDNLSWLVCTPHIQGVKKQLRPPLQLKVSMISQMYFIPN